MTEQMKKILDSSEYIKSRFPKKFSPEIAVIAESGTSLFDDFKIVGSISFTDIPHFVTKQNRKCEILLTSVKGTDLLLCKGRNHYYDGVSMRDIGHVIYTLKYSGTGKIISVDEVGHLNPRFRCGELALVYDHINLMGDNPLIGKNDNELGLRFPDMSNAYDRKCHDAVYKVFQDNKYVISDSVYIGITGPQSETDAEARFYRDTGADVAGYSLAPENITAVHCGAMFTGIGLITRELVADKMMEDARSEKQKNRDQQEALKKSESRLGKILKEIIRAVSEV